MKNYLSTLLLIICTLQLSTAQGKWETLKTGAGGWITGMDIHPDGTKYIRSDVGGAYRLNVGEDTWKQIVTDKSMPAEDVHWSNYQGVLSLAAAASSSSKVYMAYDKSIYVSNNKGDNWQRTNFPELLMEANSDDSKLFGERLVVDPANENKVYFGSIDDGLFVTEDGNNWTVTSAVPKGDALRGIRSIVFDPSSGLINGETRTLYVAVDGEGIFRSQDAGNTFEEISEGLFTYDNPHIYDMEIDSNGDLLISGKDESATGYAAFGLLKYDGNDWNQIFTEDLSIPYSEIAVDPKNPSRVLLFSEGYSETYITRNGTSSNPTWQFLGIQRRAENVPWLAWTETEWFTLGEIEFDPIVENRIWITFGTGTFYIDEDGSNPLVWNEFSAGQEHLVSNDVVSFSNGTSVTAHWDFPIFLHDEENNYPSVHGPTSRFNSSWDLSQSPTDENFVAAIVEDIRYCCWDDQTRSSGYTEDGGQTWNQFGSMPEGEFDLIFGQLEVSAYDNNNIIWLPGDYRNPFVTFDKGNSWTEVSLPGSSDDYCLGQPWFKRKALAADKVTQGKFYIYDWGSGDIFVTTDGGSSWTRRSEVLPAWSFNGKLIASPSGDGHLYFCNGPEEGEDLIEGLFRSTDGGQSWTELSQTDKVLNVSVGKNAPGSDFPTVYLCGEVNGEYGYFESTDNCATWTSIGVYPLGIYDWPSVMEANPHQYGNLKIGFSGNGFVQYSGESTQTQTEVTEHIHIDQFGYKPSFTKVAVISDPQIGFNSNNSYQPGSTLQVVDADSEEVVFSGPVVIWNNGQTHMQSGDKGWHFDFSSVETPGSYYIFDEANNTKSYEFDIRDDVYDEVLKAASKMFYYNRCNMAKEQPFAEANWVDGNNFEQDKRARFIYDQNNAALEKDMSGGWFDAGDYNKYVTFAHGAIHNLLSAYDHNPNVFGDDWNLPESGNNVPDLLDEVNWELQWLEKMMNDNGGVHIKMGARNFSENAASPPSANLDNRYYGPQCSAGSVAVASMFAHAALTYQKIGVLNTYGASLQEKAIVAFDYYLDKFNSNTLDTDCDDGSIVAGDADWEIEKQKQAALIAAIYLYDLTGSGTYGNYVTANINDAEPVRNGWLGPYTNEVTEALFYYITMDNNNAAVKDQILNAVSPHISGDWDNFYGQNDLDLYRAYMPDWSYHWGSNQAKADYGNLNTMIANYNINPAGNESYLKKSEELLHYYHGVNPLTKVYLSNMYNYGAENSVDEIYHSWFYDNTDYDNAKTSAYGPAPGFVPGGPNQFYSVDGISPPFGQPMQKSYKDFNTGFPDASWEITEPAIYYQAAYIRLLTAYATQSEPQGPVDQDGDGYVDTDDCDDNNTQVNPSQTEIAYNGIDDDCNPATMDDDLDQDGFALADDCDDNNAQINPSQTETAYNGIDDDCNPATFDDDLDQDGFVLANDCDDNNAAINPNATDIPDNGVDEDCDGADATDIVDNDGDGYDNTVDCDDNNLSVNPGQTEIPYNGVDDDCNAATLDDDLDQDGFALAEDCDDTNPNISPSQTEVPYNGIDEDCNPATLDDDLDQDGFALAEDCDDTNPNISPNQTEVPYNGIDEDCNPATLDDDLDQDGFALAEDCDDTNPNISPNQTEVPYNGIDEDCNPATLDDDLDQDGFALAEDCDDTNPNISPNQTEVPYNGIDEDCNPVTLDDDLDQDGFALAEDCDDTNPDISPNQTEVPYNGIDEDCNPATLDDDLDQDGFVLADDCDDNNPNINPDAQDIPNNGIDENCDGMDLLSLTKETSQLEVNIYPNPASDFINIEISDELNCIFAIYSLDGSLIIPDTESSKINVNSLQSGMYLLRVRIKNMDQKIFKRIIIVR